MTQPHRQRKRWHKIGYALTLIWVAAVIAVSRGERGHPLFDYIFIAPLAAWVVAVTADIAIAQWRSSGRRRGRQRNGETR